MPRKGWSKKEQESRWDAIAETLTNQKNDKSQAEPIRKTPMEKWRESEAKRKARKKREMEKTKVYTVRVYKDSPIMIAAEKAASDAGKQPGRYLRQALIEKLQRDGYIGEAPEEPEPEE